MTTPDLHNDPDNELQAMLDSLDDLVDDPPPETAPAPDPVLRIDHPAPTRENVAEVIPIEDARTRRSLRAELVVEGLHAARSAVAVIRQTFNDGTADFDDAVKALPVVHRLIEHVEKIEAAKNKLPDIPVLDIRVIPGGGLTIRQVTPPEGRRMLDDLDSDD